MLQPGEVISASEAQPPLYAGIDVGGTNIKVGIVDDRGRSLGKIRFATESARGPEAGAQRMAEAVAKVAEDAGLRSEQIVRVGLATPGTMDIPAGMLLQPHNLPGWFNFPIRDRVAHHCGKRVSYVNDAAAAAYGEFWVGSGHHLQSLILLTLGTGIGGGIIIGDTIIHGEHSHGAECGHIIIDSSPQARICPCGQPGHLEAYASATAVIARTKEALSSGHGDARHSSLNQKLAAGAQLTPKLIAEEAVAGDDYARGVVLETARWLGIGIVSLMHTIDPDGVLLGGGMNFGGDEAPLGREFIERVRQEVRQRAFPIVAERVSVEFATLGGDAGYIGAAGVARLDQRAVV